MDSHSNSYKIRIHDTDSVDELVNKIMGRDETAQIHFFKYVPYAVWHTNMDMASAAYGELVQSLEDIPGISFEGDCEEKKATELQLYVAPRKIPLWVPIAVLGAALVSGYAFCSSGEQPQRAHAETEDALDLFEKEILGEYHGNIR